MYRFAGALVGTLLMAFTSSHSWANDNPRGPHHEDPATAEKGTDEPEIKVIPPIPCPNKFRRQQRELTS